MEQNLIEQFSLPKYIKNKSFAEASKAINDKFKGREDKVSTDTKDALLERLAKAQEFVKMQEAIKTNSQQVPDEMNGEIPAGMEEFSGEQQQFANGGFDYAAAGQMAGNFVNAFGEVEPVESQDFQKVNVGGDIGKGALKGAASGAAMGSVIGPWGTAIGAGVGAVVGGATGWISGNKKKQAADIANSRLTYSLTNKYNSDFKYGGNMKNKYEGGGGLDSIFKPQFSTYQSPFNQPTVQSITQVQDRPVSKFNTVVNKTGNWLNKNSGELMRYAPIVGNAIELNKLKKSATPRGIRLDNVYKRQLFDPNSIINNINQNDINSALTESSGGDLGALRSNILSANINKTRALSDAIIKGQEINTNENRFKFENDMRRDQFNARQEEMYIDRAARDEAAYENNKSNLRKALYEDIGAVGQEQTNKKLVKELFGYDWMGDYIKKNPKATKKEAQEAMMKAASEIIRPSTEKMFGGYLKK